MFDLNKICGSVEEGVVHGLGIDLFDWRMNLLGLDYFWSESAVFIADDCALYALPLWNVLLGVTHILKFLLAISHFINYTIYYKADSFQKN